MATTDDDASAAVLARHVAEAADAWLRDPLDAGVYQRLVAATLAWRAYTRPALEGLEHAGRIEDPPTLGATLPHVTQELRRRAAAQDAETPAGE